MSVYVVVQISIHDRARYERYIAGFMPVLIKYKGRLLASDEHPEVVQGSWDRDKIILMEFEDKGAFERWSHSPEYTEISKDRVAATEGLVLLVHGLPAPAKVGT